MGRDCRGSWRIFDDVRNITLLQPFDDIDDLLRLTKVMLVPSVWAEARSRIVLEAMSRGVPVVAADVGGLHEARARRRLPPAGQSDSTL